VKNTYLECQPGDNTEMKIRKTVCGNVGYCFFNTDVWSLTPQKKFNCLLAITSKGIFLHFCLQYKWFFHNLPVHYMFPTTGTKPNVVLNWSTYFIKLVCLWLEDVSIIIGTCELLSFCFLEQQRATYIINNHTPSMPNKILYNTTIISDLGYVFMYYLTAKNLSLSHKTHLCQKLKAT